MKCYTILEDNIIPSIDIMAKPFPHICVGDEKYRGKVVRIRLDENLFSKISYKIPCPYRGKFMGEKSKCDECGVNTIVDKNTTHYHPTDYGFIWMYKPIEKAFVFRQHRTKAYIVTEEREFDVSQALVLVDIPPGTGDPNEWTCAEKELAPCPKQGEKLEYIEGNYVGNCSLCNEEYGKVDNFSNPYLIHPNSGKIKKWGNFPPPGITVVAEGLKVLKEAGTIKNSIVKLIKMGPRTYFRIGRYGNISKGLEEYFIYWDGKNMYVGSEDKVSDDKFSMDGKQLEIYKDDVF